LFPKLSLLSLQWNGIGNEVFSLIACNPALKQFRLIDLRKNYVDINQVYLDSSQRQSIANVAFERPED